jgi:fimbrial chaperone protein
VRGPLAPVEAPVLKRKSSLLLCLLLLVTPVTLCASSFTVAPVRVELSPGRPNSVVRVSNLSEEAVMVQAHAVIWGFTSRGDTYVTTDEVVLNPPIFMLAPKQSQVVRIGLRASNQLALERAYRLILEEVPTGKPPQVSGIRTILRISIPVFSRPRGDSAAHVKWLAQVSFDGKFRLTANNEGNAHLQIRSLLVRLGDNPEAILFKHGLEYLLPQQSRQWTFEDPRLTGPAQLQVTAITDAGELHETLTASPL